MLLNLRVKGLLGEYSYNLDFSEEKGPAIKFITGPNGYGKTTLLYLIFSLFRQRFENFADVEFDNLIFVFDDGKSIEVVKKEIEHQTYKEDSSDLPENIYNKQLEIKYKYPDGHLLSSATYNLDGHFNSDFNSDFVHKFNDANLRIFLNSQQCYWIDESRLINKSRVSVNKDSIAKESTMVAISDNIKEKYEKVRFFLNEDFTTKNGLSEKETTEANSFVERIEMFKKIIDKYKFTRKTLETVPQYEGIRFRVNDEMRKIILPEDLSSGEQELIDIFFELIFDAPKDSLVLIDEPETSQHLMWQVVFYHNISSVAKSKNLQIIVATHSPQVFDGKWERSIDLYAQSRKSK